MFIFAAFSFAQIKLAPHRINLQNGKSFNLNLPEDFEITPAVENLKRVRFFAKAPDGRIFVTDMHDLSDNTKGAVYILDGWNAGAGKFEKVTPYLTNLRNPNSVAFYTDANGQDWFYLAETDKLTRRKFTKGETKPSDANPQTIATFPDYGLSYKYGGWHLTRTIAFSPEGKLYVSVGSSCNACDEKEAVRASILEMNPDGGNRRFYARGLRNAVWIEWIGKYLFATNQGADHLGLNKPDETFYAIKDGADYGWASCYSAGGKIFFDTTPPNALKKPTNRLKSCENVPAPYAFFPAHSSALGFAYFDEPDSDAAIKNSFVVALHGSTNKRIGHGYKIVTVRKGEPNQDLIAGFLQSGTVMGRPCGIIKLDANSFLFTDDYSGVIYYVRKKGATVKIAADESKQSETNQTNAAQADSNSQTISPTPADSAPKNKSCFGLIAIIVGVCLSAAFSR
ncbi:MAG: PQQ-dependent sugar dehydrogenase [Pyrinomonadaceae bacterium]